MSMPMLLRDVMALPYDAEKERADMELRRRLAAEKGEVIYPEPEGWFDNLDR